MQKMKEAANEFLSHKRVAVTGVSRSPKDHGSNVVYKRLRDRGYEVFAVNPNADEVEGDPCYHDLNSVPGGVEWVVIGTKPETAEATMPRVRRREHWARMDAPGLRLWERVSGSCRVRAPKWSDGD